MVAHCQALAHVVDSPRAAFAGVSRTDLPEVPGNSMTVMLCHVAAHAGLQLSVTSLPGRPVALAAAGDLLAAVWHAGMPAADKDQCLHYSVLSMASQALEHSGPLCLSAGASLQWLGFSEEGMLAAYDSKVGCSSKWTAWRVWWLATKRSGC